MFHDGVLVKELVVFVVQVVDYVWIVDEQDGQVCLKYQNCTAIRAELLLEDPETRMEVIVPFLRLFLGLTQCEKMAQYRERAIERLQIRLGLVVLLGCVVRPHSCVQKVRQSYQQEHPLNCKQNQMEHY